MPKRTIAKITSSPPQQNLSKFLSTRKQNVLPDPKRTKTKEAGPEVKIVEDGRCSSNECTSTSEVTELVMILELIDEVILFAGKPLLWSYIQEEIYSLHKRYQMSLVQVLT